MGTRVEQPLHVAQEQLQGRGVPSGSDFCQNQGLGQVCMERISPPLEMSQRGSHHTVRVLPETNVAPGFYSCSHSMSS